MRILFLAKSLPGPHIDGYVVRNRGLLSRLADMGEVDLLTFDEGAMPDSLRASLASVTAVPVVTAGRDPLTKRAREVLSADSLFHHSAEFSSAIAALCAAHEYDAVLIGGWPLLHYIPDVKAHTSAKIIADPADDEVRSLQIDRSKAKSAIDRTYLWRDVVRNRRFEARYLTLADVALYVSSVDASSTKERHPNLNAVVSQNGVDTDQFSPPETPNTAPVFVFEGTMSFPPNIEGAVHFVQNVLPLIQAELPDAKAILVGRNPVSEVLALASDAVEVTGTVDDVRANVLRGSVFVSPLLGGVGQKNKILQAWSMAMPIVSTPISVTGLEARDGDNLLLATSAPAFADACVKLVRSREICEALGRSGRRTALDIYSVKRKLDEFEAIVRQTLGAVDPLQDAGTSARDAGASTRNAG